MLITTSVVMLAAFCAVVGILFVPSIPLGRLIGNMVLSRKKSVEDSFSSTEAKIRSVSEEVEKLEARNDSIEGERKELLLEATQHCKDLQSRLEAELQEHIEKKLEQTLKQISNYSSVILQDLRESSVDIAISALHKLITRHSQELSSTGDFSELQKDIRKKLN